MPFGARTNHPTADISQHTDQTHDVSPSPSNDQPIILPRIRQPGLFAENMPPYRSPCHSPVLVVQSPDKHSGYKHAEFSFESPPGSPEPDVTVLPNRGGLAIRSTHEDTTHRYESADSEASDSHFPRVRSASSSYPSEGMRSPAMTASPPMTFGRRILSSLEAYGFSNAHLSFLKSSESSNPVFKSGDETQVASEDAPRPDVADNLIWDLLAAKKDGKNKTTPTDGAVLTDKAHHEREKTEIDPDNDHPGHKSVDDLVRSASQNEKLDLQQDLKLPNSFPRRSKSRSTTMSLMTKRLRSSMDGTNANASTICLPRASIGMEETRPKDDDDSLPHVQHCSHVSDDNRSLERQYSSSERQPKSARSCSLRKRISHYFQLRQTVKVKKWIVNKLSTAGKKGPRIVVRKVKERKARFVFGGGSKASSSSSRGGKTSATRESQDLPAPLFHGGFHDDQKKSGSLGKSIRSIRKSVSGGFFGSGGGGARGSGSVGSVAEATRTGSGVIALRGGRVGRLKSSEEESVDSHS